MSGEVCKTCVFAGITDEDSQNPPPLGVGSTSKKGTLNKRPPRLPVQAVHENDHRGGRQQRPDDHRPGVLRRRPPGLFEGVQEFTRARRPAPRRAWSVRCAHGYHLPPREIRAVGGNDEVRRFPRTSGRCTMTIITHIKWVRRMEGGTSSLCFLPRGQRRPWDVFRERTPAYASLRGGGFLLQREQHRFSEELR